jgi:hypothetical protein
MGECNYYLKARFKNAKAAGAAESRLAALLAEGEGAYRHWQDSRQWGVPRPPAADFWAVFRERFPLVVGYLKELAGTRDWFNGLAGHLGCLVDPHRDRKGHRSASLVRSGDLLLLQLNMIWHGTDMGLLERDCREDLGAVGVGSLPEENFDWDEDSDLEEAARDPDFDPFEAIRV